MELLTALVLTKRFRLDRGGYTIETDQCARNHSEGHRTVTFRRLHTTKSRGPRSHLFPTPPHVQVGI